MEELVFTQEAGAKLRSTSERDVPPRVLDELLAKYAARCPLTARLASTLAVVKAQLNGANPTSDAETFTVEMLPRVLLDCAVTYKGEVDALVPVWEYHGVRDEPLLWEPPFPWRLVAVSHTGSVYLMLADVVDGETLRLRRPPFANVYDDGRVCTGDGVAASPAHHLCETPVLELHAQMLYSLLVNTYNSDLAAAASRCGPVCRWDATSMKQKTDDETTEEVRCLIEGANVLAPNFPDAVFDVVKEIINSMRGTEMSNYWMMSLPGLLKDGGPVLASMRRTSRRVVTGETNAEELIARRGPEEVVPEEDDDNAVPEEDDDDAVPEEDDDDAVPEEDDDDAEDTEETLEFTALRQNTPYNVSIEQVEQFQATPSTRYAGLVPLTGRTTTGGTSNG